MTSDDIDPIGFVRVLVAFFIPWLTAQTHEQMHHTSLSVCLSVSDCLCDIYIYIRIFLSLSIYIYMYRERYVLERLLNKSIQSLKHNLNM